jgi:hypothetical protein
MSFFVGRYQSAGDKPLPKPKAIKGKPTERRFSADPRRSESHELDPQPKVSVAPPAPGVPVGAPGTPIQELRGNPDPPSGIPQPAGIMDPGILLPSPSLPTSETVPTMPQPTVPAPAQMVPPELPEVPQALSASTGSQSNPNPKLEAATSGDRADWIGPGTLHVSALALDGPNRKTYSLETVPGTVKVYVLAAADVDLDRYVNKKVSIYGPRQSRPGLSKPYVIATGVERVPELPEVPAEVAPAPRSVPEPGVDSADPNIRMQQLLYQTEGRLIDNINNEWRRFWFNDLPSHLPFERIHGGIAP